MKKLLVFLCAVSLVFLGVTQTLAYTMLIPIDSTLFTWESPYAGATTWAGNSLTFHISSDPSYGGGAVTQTAILPTSVLPENITGISFEISPSGAMMDFFPSDTRSQMVISVMTQQHRSRVELIS